MPSVEGEMEYPEPTSALQFHLRDVHHNLAAGSLSEVEAEEQHTYEHLGPGGLRNHSEPVDLHQHDNPYARRLVNLIEDTTNVMREVDTALAQYPAGWVERRRQTGGQRLEAFNAWKKTLSAADAWGHCGDVTKHDEHRHTVVMNEGPSPGTCVGTPDLVSVPSTEELEPAGVYDEGYLRALRTRFDDGAEGREMVAEMAVSALDAQSDGGVERRRAERPGSQPLPIPQTGVAGAHDMVLSDLRGLMVRRQAALRHAGKTKEAEAIRQLLKEIEADLLSRRTLGLQRYGSLLQPGNGRDPLRDAYEEVVDLVCYFRQLIMARDEAVTLLTELLQDHAVGEDPVVREKVGRVMYLLAGVTKEGSNDASD